MRIARISSGVAVIFLAVFTILYIWNVHTAYAGIPCGKKVKKTSSAGLSSAHDDNCSMKACCKSATRASLKGKTGACRRAKGAQAKAARLKNIASNLPYHESKRLVLDGKYVCGRCDLDKLSICQGFIRTTDGNLYPLVNNSRLREIKKQVHNGSSTEFKITSSVRLLNGVKYLEVKSFKNM